MRTLSVRELLRAPPNAAPPSICSQHRRRDKLPIRPTSSHKLAQISHNLSAWETLIELECPMIILRSCWPNGY